MNKVLLLFFTIITIIIIIIIFIQDIYHSNYKELITKKLIPKL